MGLWRWNFISWTERALESHAKDGRCGLSRNEDIRRFVGKLVEKNKLIQFLMLYIVYLMSISNEEMKPHSDCTEWLWSEYSKYARTSCAVSFFSFLHYLEQEQAMYCNIKHWCSKIAFPFSVHPTRGSVVITKIINSEICPCCCDHRCHCSTLHHIFDHYFFSTDFRIFMKISAISTHWTAKLGKRDNFIPITFQAKIRLFSWVNICIRSIFFSCTIQTKTY